MMSMQSRTRVSKPTKSRHGGAVIIMVVSLMTTLVVLGLFFYGFATQERTNAEFFASKDPLEIDPDPVFNFGLEQVLVSTDPSLTNSALYGSRWSLAAHIMGPIIQGRPTKAHPYSGKGITITPETGNNFRVDYDGDGTDERNQDNFVLNFSPLANSGTDLLTQPEYQFNPAAGYTYPDVNSLFLALDYIDPITDERVIKPSFSLPGYFRASGYSNWYTAGGFQNRVLRPHEDLPERYVTISVLAQSGDRNRLIEPFPFSMGSVGVWNGTNTYDFDVDLDGDGIDDAIYMDLDHPLIELPNGRQVVPTFSFKIVDMDGLLNANAHGNMSDFTRRSRAATGSFFDHIANKNRWAHYSNLGLSPSEVNPQIALYADPADPAFIPQDAFKNFVTLPHRGMTADRSAATVYTDPATGRIGVGSFNRLNMANIEYGMMLLGQPNFSRDDLSFSSSTPADEAIVGRYGLDSNRLFIGLMSEGTSPAAGRFNAAGQVNADDDDDANGGTSPDGGILHIDSRLNVQIPPFVHPLDFGGTGNNGSNLTTPTDNASIIRRTSSAGIIGERILESGGLTNNPMRWPSYPSEGAWQNQGSGNTNYPTYRDAISANALQKNSTDMLVDEEDERVIDSTFPDFHDAKFLPSEIAALHLSDADWTATNGVSRLRALVPFNFEYNRQANQIRSQFTTESWDRLQFAFSRFADTTTRAWEFNDSDRFPPKFDGAGSSRHESGTIAVADPFRPEVRRLLTIRDTSWGTVNNQFPQRKLHLNRILSDDSYLGGDEAFDENSNPVFRNLVPHPNFSSDQGTIEAMVHDNLSPSDVNGYATSHPIRRFSEIGTDLKVQEWWARYDRQRLARDIYVLLYVLAGNDGTIVDPPAASSPVSVAVDADQAREIAQFAVNYVDALDRDDVITEFIYDADLSNGWDAAPTEAVYGIEEQKLAFSEVLLFETDSMDNDSPRTLHDDRGVSGNGHRFLYIELRNLSPFDIRLDEETWRIARVSKMGVSEIVDKAVTFKPQTTGGTPKIIPAGENFVIACHDGTVRNGNGDPIGSEVYINVDTDQDGDPLQIIFPRSNATTEVTNNNETPAPVVDFDLTPRNGHADENYRVFGGTDAASMYMGTTLVEPTETGDTGPAFTLLLQRRRNLRGEGTGESDWIEVDRFFVNPNEAREISGQTFLESLPGNTQPNQAQLTNQLKNWHSVERKHAYSDQDSHPFHVVTDGNNTVRNHTLRIASDSQKNAANQRWIEDNGNVPYWFWQPHFDRDFSSVMELLSIPIYGNRNAGDTSADDDSSIVNRGVTANLVNTTADTMRSDRTAQVRFLDTAQRWYRLLNFIEVPPRTQDIVESQISRQRRTPGRVNLNLIRHEHVLAGLIDDTVHHDPLSTEPTEDLLNSGRDWTRELFRSRDIDENSSNTSLPGTHHARPFRPLGFIHPGTPDQSLRHTILRRNFSTTPNDLENLGIFEARPTTDFGVDDIDYHTRHRLLAKVANNTTTRSHVFAMWVGITFHESHKDGMNVKLGAEAADLPRYRMFCVVDMSRLEEAFDPATGTFDFRKFVIHRQQLP